MARYVLIATGVHIVTSKNLQSDPIRRPADKRSASTKDSREARPRVLSHDVTPQEIINFDELLIIFFD
jgi:hypothetical protein